jgi:hypothetical protein
MGGNTMATFARGPGDSWSAAKLGLYGGIITALITAVGGIIGAVVNHPGSSRINSSIESTATTIVPTSLSQVSDRGTYDKLVYNESGVTVYGHTESNVDGVFVLVGPKPSGGYWSGFGAVFNQHWQADVATQEKIQPDEYPVTTYYHRSGGGAARPSAFKITFEATTPTTVPPLPTDQIVNCAKQFGPSCFTGPEWGPPSVYQPNQ